MADAAPFELYVDSAPFTLHVPVHVHVSPDADGSALVALHGMGMSPRSFARDVLELLPRGCSAIIPQAPLPYELRRPDKIRQGNSWYVYLGDDRQFVASMERTEEWLLRTVDRALAAHDLDPARVSLLGFSQGGYLAGYVGLRHPAGFRRLVVAGGRIKHEVLEERAREAALHHTGFRVLAAHGEQDQSVAAEAVRSSASAIAACGVPVEVRTYAHGHDVLRHEACRADVRTFLAAD